MMMRQSAALQAEAPPAMAPGELEVKAVVTMTSSIK
jgi:hypothetical protein